MVLWKNYVNKSENSKSKKVIRQIFIIKKERNINVNGKRTNKILCFYFISNFSTRKF